MVARALLLPICLLSAVATLHAQSLEALLKEAGTELNKGNVAESKQLAYRAYNKADKSESPLLGRASFELAKAFHISGNFDSATSYYQKALEFADVHRDSILLSKVLTSLGVLRISNEMYEAGERNVLLALSISQQTGDLATEARCLSHLGQSQYRQKGYQSALNHFRAASLIASRQQINTLLSACYNNMGLCQAALQLYDSAAYYTEMAIELRKSSDQVTYLNEYFTNLTYIHIQGADLNKALESEHMRFKLLNDSGLALDRASMEPQGYIHQSFVDLNLKKNEHEQLMESKLNASKKEASMWFIAFAVALLAFIVIVVWLVVTLRKLAFHVAEAHDQQQITQSAKSHLEQQLEALKTYDERMKVLFQSKNDLLPNCYELLSRNFNYTEIGNIIGKDSTTVGRYMSEVCALLNTNKEALKKEAVELGALMWSQDPSEKAKRF